MGLGIGQNAEPVKVYVSGVQGFRLKCKKAESNQKKLFTSPLMYCDINNKAMLSFQTQSK